MIGAVALGFLFFMAHRRAEKQVLSLFDKLAPLQETKRTVIYAADGKTKLYVATGIYRRAIVDYKEIPDTVRNATLAAEDKRFFAHDGVDAWAVARAISTIPTGSPQGGSTLTMQLAKRLFTSTDKTLTRKMDDAAIALQIERMITKQEILKAYLNEAFYGQGAYGIKSAAEVYFGKSMKELTVAEAALLSRCVRTPSKENPFTNLKKAIENRDVVLAIMREENMISQQEYEKALKEVPKLQKKHVAGGERILSYPYFARYVIDWVKDHYPDLDLQNGGYKIYTTLDPRIQKITEEEAARLVRRNRGNRVTTAAFVVMDADGKVLAMQGGVDYERNRFNVVYQGRRQPGSSFKPFIYSTGLSNGAFGPGDRISDEPIHWRDPGTGKVWSPAGGGHGGSYSIADAIGYSKNVPAIHASMKAGLTNCAAYARDIFGFTSQIRPVRSMALGVNEVAPIEMAQAYSIFMLGGDRATPYPVTMIRNSNDEVVQEFLPDIRKGMLDANVAGLMDRYLRYVVTNGTGKEANGRVADARGKTGTTNDNKDAWFCGYTNNLIGIGWIANEQKDKDGSWSYHPMSSYVMGGTVTVDLWSAVMARSQAILGKGTARNLPALERNTDVETQTRPSTGDEPLPTEEAPPAKTDEQPTENTPVGETGNTKTKTEPPADQPETVPVDRPQDRPKPTPPPSNDEGGESVTVEICADTGQRATMYCPETVGRKFAAGKAPRRYCKKHSGGQ